MNSTRLPGKVMLPILDKPVLWHIFQRLANCKTLDEICIATSKNSSDDIIVEFAKKEGIKFFRGEEEKIADRLVAAANEFDADAIVRITGDCPLVDPLVIDELVSIYRNDTRYDYVSNIIKRTFPDGLDTEVISVNFLRKIFTEIDNSKKHFSTYIIKNHKKFNYYNYENDKNLAHLRWTLDYEEDFEFIKSVYSKIYPINPNFVKNDILKLLNEEPHLSKINEKYCS